VGGGEKIAKRRRALKEKGQDQLWRAELKRESLCARGVFWEGSIKERKG